MAQLQQLPLPENVEQVHMMLCEFMDNTEKARRLAVENAIARGIQMPEIMMLFIQLMRMNPNSEGLRPGVRQLAAVLLRKKFPTLWNMLDLQRQAELKQILLDLLGNEPGRSERLAFAALIDIVARAELREGHVGWPELLTQLQQACRSGNPDFVEIAMKIITTTAQQLMLCLRVVKKERKRRNPQTNPQAVAEQENLVMPLVRDCVADALRNGSTPKVRVAALEALNAILPHVHGTGDVKRDIVGHLLPAALDCVVQAATANSPDGLTMALKTMDVLCDILELEGKSQHQFVFSAIDFLTSTASTKTLHPRLREQAVEIIGDFVAARPKTVMEQNMVGRFFTLALELMSEDERLCLSELAADADAPQQIQAGTDGGGDDDDDDYMDEDMNKLKPPCTVGGRLIKVMSMNLPSKVFAPMVISAASSASVAGDPLKLKAAMVGLACAAEGCSAALRKQVTAILQMTKSMFSGNSQPFVKEAASFGLGLFCRYLQPEILHMSDTTIPMLMSQLDMDNSPPDLLVSTARALELLCETLDADLLAPHAQDMLSRLMSVLCSDKVTPSTQYYICGVLTQVIDTESPTFLARGEDIIRVLMGPMRKPMQSHNDMMLRSKIMETVSVTGLAIGAQRFGPFFDDCWACVQESLRFQLDTEDVSPLHESCFSFVSNMARAGGDQFFGGQVAIIVPIALDILDDDSYVKMKKHKDPLGVNRNKVLLNSDNNAGVPDSDKRTEEDILLNQNNQQQQQQPNSAASAAMMLEQEARRMMAAAADEEEHAGGPQQRMNVRIADVDMRCAVIHSFGQMAEYCPRSFSRFAKDVYDVLMSNTFHFYGGIKQKALEELARVAVSLRHEFEGEIEIFRGKAPPHDSLPPKMRQALDTYISDAVLSVWTDEEDRDVVASGCTGLITVLETLGSVGVHNFIDRIVDGFVAILRREAPCDDDAEWDDALTSDDDEDDVLDEDVDGGDGGDGGGGDGSSPSKALDDHDQELIDLIGELIEALVGAYGADFAPYFEKVASALDRYCAPDRPGEDHVMAMGALAETVQKIGPACSPYFRRCLEIALAVIDHTDEIVAKLNSCFMFSALAAHCRQKWTPDDVQNVLKAVWILLETCKGVKATNIGGTTTNPNDVDSPGADGLGPEEFLRTEDNAISAVCSLIKSNLIPFGGPIENVLPSVFEHLPPKADFRESENCLSALAHLASHNMQQLIEQPNLGTGFVRACAKCLVSSRVEDNHKGMLSTSLRGTIFNRNLQGSGFFVEAANELAPPRYAAAMRQVYGGQ